MNINIGAGKWTHEGWITLGNHTKYETDYNIIFDLNLENPLPLEDNSVDIFYCSHVLEHLSNKKVNHIIKELYRTLKPKGVVRILVPDLERAYNKFISREYNDEFFMTYYRQKDYPFLRNPWYLYNIFYSRNDIDEKEFKKNLRIMNMEDLFNYYTKDKEQIPESAGEHINWFTFNKFKDILKDYSEVYQSKPGESRFEEMRGEGFDFFKRRNLYSLIVEAIK